MTNDQRPPAPLDLPHVFPEVRARIADLSALVRTAKDATTLRGYCVELNDLATAVVGGVDRLAKQASAAAWPRDLNAQEADPGWGLDPAGVRRD